MASISMVWDQRQLKVWRDRLPQKAIARALQRAGSDAIRALKTSATRQVRFRKRLKVNRIQRALPVSFPRGKLDLENLAWTMHVSGETIPASAYPYRQTRKGVSLAINAGKRTMVPQAFVATMKSGHRGIFLRGLSDVRGPVTRSMAKTGQRMRVGRLKIDELLTTRISDVFDDTGMIPAAQSVAMRKFAQTFERNVIAELNKLNRNG